MNAGPFAIIGNPVQNSLSPALFRAAYPHAPERTYGRLEAPAAETAWELVQSLGLRGGNVTMPFKAAFARFATVKDEAVTAIGATNLILNRGNGWEAYNTDHYGVVESFREAGAGLKDEPVLVIGTGGAGKAAAWGLEKAGATVFMANRTYGGSIAPLTEVPSLLKKCALVVNTIPWEKEKSIGLGFRQYHLVLDASYTNAPLKETAEESGMKYLGGAFWLYHQAVRGFEILTGDSPCQKAMRALLNL